MKKDPVLISNDAPIQKLLEYYMGTNTPARQKFIIENLVVEKDEAIEVNKEILTA